MEKNYIEVNATSMDNDIREMEAAIRDIRNDMKVMFDSVVALDAMWDGPANETFVRQFMVDREAFGDLCESMDGFVESMKNARDEYRKCEGNVNSIINGIKI